MNLYLISQDENTTYDTYDSAVVCASDEDTARRMHPSGNQYDLRKILWWESTYKYPSWASSLEQVSVKLIGTAASYMPEGIVCASFNAG